MSVLWHLMFWVMLPAALYGSVRAYDNMRSGR
jgi:hypothetical protein